MDKAIHKTKQISQQTQTHQFKNQNYQQISNTIKKENTSQQKFDQTRNIKYHSKNVPEMANRLPSIFNNPIARKKKKRKWSSFLIVY